MPYIAKEDRDYIDRRLFIPADGGELQYAIARLINSHYNYIAEKNGSVRYKDMEAIMGALSGALNEHYRCVVSPYEDKKMKENGGVYQDYNTGDSDDSY